MFAAKLVSAMLLVAVTVLNPVFAVNRCGTSYSAAGSKCDKCPRGIDSECPAGETCYAGLPDCTSTPPPTATVNRCGTSYSNASTKCNKCPRGIDGECPAGETCYAGLPDCTSGSTPPPTAPTPPGSCGSTTGETYATLSCEQIDNARTIIGVGKGAGIPEYGWVIALATATQESRIRNLDYGDRDSVGLFQQRVSTGWCPNGECSDPVKSSKAFYGVADFTNNQGLLQVPDWQNKAVTVVAQDVQVSCCPDAYAQWEGLARDIVANQGDAPAIL